ncbi:MAG: hypothetical protein H6704_30960 [Myxococcales bacterium]|nr:hypothetical protein [Myxococcales bacterium]MCB9540663.1 hypothetical protein [Myxococcales bacterium]
MADEKVQVRFEYEDKSPVSVVVSGCFGGVTASGFVQASAYFDRLRAPRSGTLTIEGGRAVESAPPGDMPTILREVVSTWLLTPDAAIAVGQWLLSQGQRVKQTAETVAGDPDDDRSGK